MAQKIKGEATRSVGAVVSSLLSGFAAQVGLRFPLFPLLQETKTTTGKPNFTSNLPGNCATHVWIVELGLESKLGFHHLQVQQLQGIYSQAGVSNKKSLRTHGWSRFIS